MGFLLGIIELEINQAPELSKNPKLKDCTHPQKFQNKPFLIISFSNIYVFKFSNVCRSPERFKTQLWRVVTGKTPSN